MMGPNPKDWCPYMEQFGTIRSIKLNHPEIKIFLGKMLNPLPLKKKYPEFY